MIAQHTAKLLSAFKRAFPSDMGGDDPHEVAKVALDDALQNDEDVLTALVFERLRYLPPRVSWRVLVESSTPLRGERPEACDVDEVMFWESFSHPADSRRVEPDVVWVGARLVLGIEVKWNDVQSVDQLDREHAALEHDLAKGRQVVLLALGGMSAGRREELRNSCSAPTLLALEWEDFFGALRAERAQAERVPHEHAVLDDLMAILAFRRPFLSRKPLALATLPSWQVVFPGAAAVPFESPPDVGSFATLPLWRITLPALPEWSTR